MNRIEFNHKQHPVFGFNADFKCIFRDHDTVVFTSAICEGRTFRFEQEGNEIDCYLDTDLDAVYLGTCTGRTWSANGRSGIDWRGGEQMRDWFRSQSEKRGGGAGYIFGWYWPTRYSKDPLGYAVQRFLRCLYHACDVEVGSIPWDKREEAE